jgi:hypothetical protein
VKGKFKVTIVLMALFLIISCNNRKKDNKKPNVVLVISDQWSTRIAYGSGNYSNGIQTPGVDRLYAEGVRHKDLVREGKFVEFGKRGLSSDLLAQYNDDARRSVFQIDPQTVISSMGITTQNEGY